MGEYWKPVNVTRMECIHPHDFNDGLKLGEWFHTGDFESATLKALRKLCAGPWKNDVVLIASDYGGLMPYHVPTHSNEAAGLDGEELYDESNNVSRAVKADRYTPGPAVWPLHPAVDAVLQTLNGLGGFDHWWGDVEGETRGEIRRALDKAIRETL